MELFNLGDKEFKNSRFMFLFKRGFDVLLYHSILMKVLSPSKEDLELYKMFASPKKARDVLASNPKISKSLEMLISSHFLVSSNVDEVQVFRDYFKDRTRFSINLMYLLSTDDCNFRCKYCFIEECMPKEHKFSYMDVETMKKAIDFFASQNATNIGTEGRRILLYGGEPLLNPKITIQSVEYTNSRWPIHLITNGSLITKEIAKFLADNDVFVSVSLDGPKEVNDKIRIFKDGSGTFNSVKRGYKLLRDAGCKNAGISLTIASHNVHNLRDNVEYLVDELKPTAFGFNFLLDFPQSKNPFGVPIDYATEKTIEAFKFLREKGIFEERMMRKIKPFVEETIHLKDCGGIGNQIVVAPDGEIGPCQAFLSGRQFFSQRLSNPNLDLEKDSVFQEWSKRYPLNMEECLDCEAIGICGGGCPNQAYISTGSIWGLDERMCHHNKDFLRWLIWDIYDAKKSKSKIQASKS